MFEEGGAGESPGLGLGGVCEGVVGVGGGGVGGGVPEGGWWVGLGVGLGEGEVEEGAGGCVGVVGVGCFVEGEEGEQAGDGSGGVVLGLLSGVVEGVVEVLGVGVGVVESEGDGGDAVVVEVGEDVGDVGVVGLGFGDGDEPGLVGLVGGGEGEGFPGFLVGPGVDAGLVVLVAVPGGECGHHRVQSRGVDVEGFGEALEVFLVHRVPELRLGGVWSRAARTPLTGAGLGAG
uniref:Uncharacterized protein n=1 Tax=Streptomyces avermitilis TaxID=33903 RepID=A0A499VG43_STRAX|nr:hypothetical protein SAVMC3_11700 [Streptomyces avermitilis]